MNNFNEDMLTGKTKEAIDILGRKWKYECMSCAIAKGELELPGGLIYEDEYITVGADTEIPLNGFIIIAPKRHVNSIADLNTIERHELIDYIARIIEALRELNIVHEVTIVQEERSKHCCMSSLLALLFAYLHISLIAPTPFPNISLYFL